MHGGSRHTEFLPSMPVECWGRGVDTTSEGAMVQRDRDHVVAQARAFLPDTARRRTEISTRDYKFVSDEPHLGNPGEGPTPTEYLLMALASCTAQTLRQYIDYKLDYAGDITVQIDYHEPRREGEE